MIEIIDKTNCCGCGACMNICPIQCIKMLPDYEGFLYPNVDKNTCVNCGLCEKACPILNVSEDKSFQQQAYIVQNKDEIIRRQSTSGGAFTAIAKYAINNGGAVYGVCYSDNFIVKHSRITEISELYKFRNSKYVQSDIGYTYCQVLKDLKWGNIVCFSGTPCQIEGLKRFLDKEYENLITIDFVCHAVPSPLIWNKYLEMQIEKLNKVPNNILFRDKHYGYKYSTMTFVADDVNIYSQGVDTDPMLRAYFSDICDRPSCYNCKFKKRYRMSDFTIWDCFTVNKFDKSYHDDKGTTRMLIHSSKGRGIFECVKDDLNYKCVFPDRIVKGVKEMFESVSINASREDFFADANNLSGSLLFNKYFPANLNTKLKHFLRIFCCNIGVYQMLKDIYSVLRKR